MKNCLFCRIVSGEHSGEIIIKTKKFVVFEDAFPKAPVHVLIVPRRHIEKPDDLTPTETVELFELSKKVAQIKNVRKSGYRLVFNVGKKAGQEIDHVHMHLIGGALAKSIY